MSLGSSASPDTADVDVLGRGLVRVVACFTEARVLGPLGVSACWVEVRVLVGLFKGDVRFAEALVLGFIGVAVFFAEARVLGFVSAFSGEVPGARGGKVVRRPTHTVSDAVSMITGGTAAFFWNILRGNYTKRNRVRKRCSKNYTCAR